MNVKKPLVVKKTPYGSFVVSCPYCNKQFYLVLGKKTGRYEDCIWCKKSVDTEKIIPEWVED